MNLFTKTEYDQLIKNGHLENRGKDHYPVVKVFVTGTGTSFVLTEIRSEKPLMAYGLCNTGDESKLSQIDLDKLIELAERNGSQIKKTDKFNAKSPISVFVNSAKRRKSVWEIKSILNQSQTVH